jgi:hypothetical protein
VAAGGIDRAVLGKRQPTGLDQPHRAGQRDHGGERADQHRDRGRVVEFRKRRFRHDAEQERRQRCVEQEEIHPGEAGFRQSFGLAAGEADEDQAEIWQCEIEDIDHETRLPGSVFRRVAAWNRSKPKG